MKAWWPTGPYPMPIHSESPYRTAAIQLYEDPYAFPDLLSDYDEYLLAEGTHESVYETLGAHILEMRGRKPAFAFAVWAPNAERVSVVGDFNQWDGRRHPMRFHHSSGIWDIFIPGLAEGTLYKYEVKTRHFNYAVAKSDPVGSLRRTKTKYGLCRLGSGEISLAGQ